MNPGEWYAAKDAKARRLVGELKDAKDRKAPVKEIRRLERELERARYVGD